ncbi:hypothetical protein [Methanofollis ethanolicus]|uniref:hypothetical protein n=1 Tax=Methanofollis ethanolicus TaxID=488124 RepID=UPI00082B336E|nr:hypothetical protein [Methanofollis ethanolicus]
MERLDDDGQWVVMMGFIVAVGFFFLALVVNQATLVGQTTAEGVLEFPKSDIRDLRSEVIDIAASDSGLTDTLKEDIKALSLARKNAVVEIVNTTETISEKTYTKVQINFNNGVTAYNETAYV